MPIFSPLTAVTVVFAESPVSCGSGGASHTGGGGGEDAGAVADGADVSDLKVTGVTNCTWLAIPDVQLPP